MAPTNSGPPEKRQNQTERVLDRRSELICRVKYGNTLPDIPFDLKFLQYPFDSQRFVKYNPTSLERNYKYDVLAEHDLGVTIDLINRDSYQADPNAQLDPADEKLLEEDVHMPQDSIRSRQHSRTVSWLRKSEYISTEQTRFQPQNLENIEAKVGFNVKKSLRGETLYLDREAQIKAIEKTFSDSKQEITKHFSKPNVVPIEVLPIYPDFENWKYPCAQVIFDSDPAPLGKEIPAQIEEMSQAMIRGVMDESGEQFVAYFLPTDKTLQKRRQDQTDNVIYKDGEDYEYKIAREYNWNVKSKASKGYEENYFFVTKPDGVYYNELETRVRLNKRRVKAGQPANNTKLVIKHRPLDGNEHRMQRYREKQLDHAGDEEEEMEMEDAEEKSDDIQQKGAANDDTTVDKVKKKEKESDSAMRSRSNSAGSPKSPARNSHSRSRSRSPSRSRSRSRSRSHSHSRTNSRSRSPSRSHSGSRSRSNSRSRSSSHSSSMSNASAAKSPIRSGSKSKMDNGVGSGTENEQRKSRSISPHNSEHSSRSRSRSRSQSLSRSRSGSRSQSKEKSVTPTNSRQNSRSKSPVSKSGSGSASHSPLSVRSGSKSPSGIESGADNQSNI